MNKNVYLNVVVTIFLLLFLALGAVIVTAIDRHRYALEELTVRLKKLEKKLNAGTLTVQSISNSNIPVTADRIVTDVPVAVNRTGANAEYFDPKATEGGRLIRAFASDVGNMNYLITNDAYVSQIWQEVNDTLAERNYKDMGSGKYEPMLAESWKLSPDHKKIRVKLRKGVLWHDFKDPVTGKEWKNKEVTAHDFKFYVDVLKNPAVDCAPLRVYYNDLEKIEIINDYEFDVIWRKPYFMMEDMTLALAPLPRHLYYAYPGPFDGKKFNDDHTRNRMLVGCGPYRFERWEKGKRILLRRFENYYGKKIGIMPPLEILAFDIIQHENTRLQSLLSNELDMSGLSPDQWINRTNTPAFSSKGTLKKYRYPGTSYSYIGLNQKIPVFQDKQVRQALNYLIDRDRIRKDIYRGLVTPVSGPFTRQSSAYDKNIEPYPYDPEKAARMLKDAGWKDADGDGILEKDGRKLTFTIIYPNTSVSTQKMLPIVRESMKKAGIRMDLLGIEWSVLVQRLEKKQFEACILGWTGTLKPDPYQLWHSSQANVPSSSNHIGFVNTLADQLIEKIRICFNDAERDKLYHQFHKLIYDESPYLFLFSPDNLVVIHKRYNNVSLFPGGIATRPLWVSPEQQQRLP